MAACCASPQICNKPTTQMLLKPDLWVNLRLQLLEGMNLWPRFHFVTFGVCDYAERFEGKTKKKWSLIRFNKYFLGKSERNPT